VKGPAGVHPLHAQAAHLQRVQAGTLELLRGRDEQLRRARGQQEAAEAAHKGRKQALQGMCAAVAAAAEGGEVTALETPALQFTHRS